MQKEGRIALAMDSLEKGYFTSLRGIAKLYNVERSILQCRVRGQLAQCNSQPTNYKLTNTKESTLV